MLVVTMAQLNMNRRSGDRWFPFLTSYEAVSGWGPGFDLFKDKSPNAFLKDTYPDILVSKFTAFHTCMTPMDII